MTTPSNTPIAARGPFDWLFTPLDEWNRLVMVARELREIDRERMETMLQAHASGPHPLSPEETVKVRSLVQMLEGLGLDQESIRLKQPEVMQKLKTTCISCTERNRCDHELAAGTAAGTYPDFCPNAPHLTALLIIQEAAA